MNGSTNSVKVLPVLFVPPLVLLLSMTSSIRAPCLQSFHASQKGCKMTVTGFTYLIPKILSVPPSPPSSPTTQGGVSLSLSALLGPAPRYWNAQFAPRKNCCSKTPPGSHSLQIIFENPFDFLPPLLPCKVFNVLV